MQPQFRQGSFYSLGKPFQELMELNIRTLENLSNTHSVDLLKPHKPQELIDKNFNTLIQSGHNILDYFQDACTILEKYWLIVSYDVLEQNHQLLKHQPKMDLDAPVKRAKSKLQKKASALKKTALKRQASATTSKDGRQGF